MGEGPSELVGKTKAAVGAFEEAQMECEGSWIRAALEKELLGPAPFIYPRFATFAWFEYEPLFSPPHDGRAGLGSTREMDGCILIYHPVLASPPAVFVPRPPLCVRYSNQFLPVAPPCDKRQIRCWTSNPAKSGSWRERERYKDIQDCACLAVDAKHTLV